MDYEAFENNVVEILKEKLGKHCRVERGNDDSSDRIKGHPIFIGRQGINASLIFRMEEYYGNESLTDEDVNDAVEKVIAACAGNLPDRDINVSAYAEWGSIKSHIHAKLVNTERNRMCLSDIPHREFLDLSLVYYACTEEVFPDKHITIPVWNEHMQHWGVDEETLFHTAMENMPEDDIVFEGLAELLQPFLGMKTEEAGFLEEPPMFVLADKSCLNGAVQIYRQDVMERIAAFFKDDFWILPSSIHEVILMPAGRYGEDAKGLAKLVKEINDTEVAPEEILSYHVYRYCRLSGEITIAA